MLVIKQLRILIREILPNLAWSPASGLIQRFSIPSRSDESGLNGSSARRLGTVSGLPVGGERSGNPANSVKFYAKGLSNYRGLDFNPTQRQRLCCSWSSVNYKICKLFKINDLWRIFQHLQRKMATFEAILNGWNSSVSWTNFVH